MPVISNDEHLRLWSKAKDGLCGAEVTCREGKTRLIRVEDVVPTEDGALDHRLRVSIVDADAADVARDDAPGQGMLMLESRPPEPGAPHEVALVLTAWEVRPRGRGIGGAFLARLTAFADDHEIPMQVTNAPEGETKEKRDRFWRRHGFFDSTGSHMEYWRPVGGAGTRRRRRRIRRASARRQTTMLR